MCLDGKIYSNNGNQGGFVIDGVKLKYNNNNNNKFY